MIFGISFEAAFGLFVLGMIAGIAFSAGWRAHRYDQIRADAYWDGVASEMDKNVAIGRYRVPVLEIHEVNAEKGPEK